MIRHYESGRIELEMHSFMLFEAIKLGLQPLGIETFAMGGDINIKVFLHQNKDYMNFKAEIEQLKQKCQEIVKAYKEFQIEISFFSTKIEENLDHKRGEET
jgi:hypothetical protein